MKKIFLGLGVISVIAFPIFATVSCSHKEEGPLNIDCEYVPKDTIRHGTGYSAKIEKAKDGYTYTSTTDDLDYMDVLWDFELTGSDSNRVGISAITGYHEKTHSRIADGYDLTVKLSCLNEKGFAIKENYKTIKIHYVFSVELFREMYRIGY